MNGIVFDIKRGVTRDGPGFRTSVFLKGCPLRCAWCHNPESQAFAPEYVEATGEVCGREVSVEEVLAEVRRDNAFYTATGGGMTLTGGEPTAQFDFALSLAASAHDEGIHVALDTCGQVAWEKLSRFLPVTDLILYDLKCMDGVKHRELTGADNAQILENLRQLDDVGVRLWIRAPLVPGLNDSHEDLLALRDYVASFKHVEKFEICPYHPLGLEKYAKFGKKVLYSNSHAPSEDVISRWQKVIGL